MATRINRIDNNIEHQTTLQIEGELLGDEARLLERISLEIRAETGNCIKIDLADLDFLDSEAAPILKRLSNLDGFVIEGVEIFLQAVVNETERRDT